MSLEQALVRLVPREEPASASDQFSIGIRSTWSITSISTGRLSHFSHPDRLPSAHVRGNCGSSGYVKHLEWKGPHFK
jgi:hypothetical protein